MTQELAKRQCCVQIRGGIELWIDEEKAPLVKRALTDSSQKFIEIQGQMINVYEILGVFTPEAMEERTRRKNGEWQCHIGNWHQKEHQCRCKPQEKVTAFVEGVGEIEYSRDKK